MSVDGGPGSGPQAIFLIGSGHSGKTEVAAGLRELPGTVVVRHAYYWRDLYGRCGALSREDNLARCLDRLGRDDYIRSAGVDLETLTRFTEFGDISYGSLFWYATAEASRNLGGSSSTPIRLVVQIGGLERRALVVSEDLAAALFIHTIRDPRQYFGGSPSRPGRLGWRLGAWSMSAASAARNTEALPDRYLVVRGEDVIESPDLVGSSISNLVGAEVGLDTASGSLLKKGSPLPANRTTIVESLVGQQLHELGYALNRSAGSRARPTAALDVGAYRLRISLSSRWGEIT